MNFFASIASDTLSILWRRSHTVHGAFQLDDPDEVAHNYATVLATLSAIGGVDERPRLGGLVQHADWATL